KARPARSGNARQEARRGLVSETGTHPRMGEPGDDREIAAKVPEDIQVRGELVVSASPFRKEIGRVEPQRRAQAHHAPFRLGGRPALLREGVEPGQGQGDAGGLEEMPAGKFHGRVLGWMVILTYWQGSRQS